MNHWNWNEKSATLSIHFLRRMELLFTRDYLQWRFFPFCSLIMRHKKTLFGKTSLTHIQIQLRMYKLLHNMYNVLLRYCAYHCISF